MARTPFRSASWMLPLLLSMSLGSALAVADEPVAAIPVSPGDSQAGALIGDPCPNFSWGAVAGAQRYELAIFDAQWDDSPGYEDQQRIGVALRRIKIDAPALSWTPAGSECLDEGGSYLWFVRAETAAGAEEPWSAPRYFEIDYDADALTQTVRRELASQLRQPEVWQEVIQAALSTNGRLHLTPLVLGAVVPTSEADGSARADAERGEPGAVSVEAIGVLATTFPNPSALKVNSPNGVVFNRSATGGGIPAEGDGTRFMWYPGKGALRAGAVGGDQWDDTNIGYHSTAMGRSTTASGEKSTALGYITNAIGDYSTALGDSTTASGDNSTALGIYTVASGDRSMAMGAYTTAQSYAETAIGRYNTLAVSFSPNLWVSTDRLFVIGNGASSSAPSDALVVLKNGRVGLGVSKPTYRLQLAENSAAKPGSTTWTVDSDARLKDITGPYESGLAEIAALQPVRYHYAVDNARGHDPEPEYVGFIAQQAQAVFPEAVSEGADGYLDFNMHAVNVAMVNAIQTLREENQALQAQHLAQEAQIAALQADKAVMEHRLVSLEAEQRRSANLQAQMARLQAQMQVLQG